MVVSEVSEPLGANPGCQQFYRSPSRNPQSCNLQAPTSVNHDQPITYAYYYTIIINNNSPSLRLSSSSHQLTDHFISFRVPRSPHQSSGIDKFFFAGSFAPLHADKWLQITHVDRHKLHAPLVDSLYGVLVAVAHLHFQTQRCASECTFNLVETRLAMVRASL